MMTYIYWDVSPELFSIGELSLPFPISIIGFFVSLLSFGYVQDYVMAKLLKKKKQKSASGVLLTIILFALYVALWQLIGNGLNITVIHIFGPYGLRWYTLFFMLAFVLGYTYGKKLFIASGKPGQFVDNLFIYVFIGILVGARLGHVFFYNPEYFLSNPAQILKIWEGGLASHGALIGVLLATTLFAWQNKVSYLFVIDRMVIFGAIGGAFVRLGNFFNSEIIGTASNLPWAVLFARVDTIPRHPTMLYEMVWYVAVFFILLYLYRRYYGSKSPNGLLTGAFLTLIFSGRFAFEFVKDITASFATDWLLNMGHVLSIPFIIIGMVLFYRSYKVIKNNKQ